MTYKFMHMLFEDATVTPTEPAESTEQLDNTTPQVTPQEPSAEHTSPPEQDINAIIANAFDVWQSRRDADTEDWHARYNALYAETERARLTNTAKAALLSHNITNLDASIVNTLIAEDDASTAERVAVFAKAFNNAVEEAVRNKYRTKPPQTGDGEHLTKESILAVTNRAERQRLMRDNIELFTN